MRILFKYYAILLSTSFADDLTIIKLIKLYRVNYHVVEVYTLFSHTNHNHNIEHSNSQVSSSG